MSKECVYILHKNGANSHYTGLKFLLEKNDIELKYHEFCVLSKLFKAIAKFNFKLFKKQLGNIYFFIQLLISKDKKIVLGIAPYDYRLVKILPYLKQHQVYYHSSWTCWDKSFYPNRKKNSPKVFDVWKTFLEEVVKHHFVVTTKTKNELVTNYNIKTNKISVVYHSLKPEFLELNKTTQISKKKNSFIYLGRLLPQKGIEEVLAFFKLNKDCHMTIIGNGKLENRVKEASQENENITYIPFLSNIKSVAKAIKSHEFMLLNSKKTNKWEELFGLVIIEGMSQATIPIATNHSGPKEIIHNNNGYLFKEGMMKECLQNILKSGGYSNQMGAECVQESKKYTPEEISNNWLKILN